MTYNVWRIEDPVGRHGLWRNFDGSPSNTFDKLTVGKCRDLPMEDSDFYRFNGKQWFSACDSPNKLKNWFCASDVSELNEIGQHVYMFEVKTVRKVSDYEVVFKREDIVKQVQIDPVSIWKKQK